MENKIYPSEKKLLTELASAGFNYTGINEIHNQRELGSDEVRIILKWLPIIYQDHLGSGDHLVRALISAKENFNPQVLIDLLEENKYNKSINWGIAHVLSIAKTFDISVWIKDQLLNKNASFERSGLLRGLVIKAGIQTRSELIEILKKLFYKYSYFELYFKIYRRYADKEDITFLEKNFTESDKNVQKEIKKTIEAITTRKKENTFPPRNIKW